MVCGMLLGQCVLQEIGGSNPFIAGARTFSLPSKSIYKPHVKMRGNGIKSSWKPGLLFVSS